MDDKSVFAEVYWCDKISQSNHTEEKSEVHVRMWIHQVKLFSFIIFVISMIIYVCKIWIKDMKNGQIRDHAWVLQNGKILPGNL